MSGFYADFPAFDPFPDPSSLASPVTLRRADRNATIALSDNHVLRGNKVNELRAGLFYLNNTRQLDDPFLDVTNASVGIPNPANFFDSSSATTRLGHYVGAPGTLMERFSFGGPNDTFNRRQQRTWTFGNTLSWSMDAHAIRIGGEYRRNEFDTNLPEEQATEFEKFESFTTFLRGLAREGDTQFGITDKRFRFDDFNVFIADEWRLSPTLTANVGVRYEFFGWPTELDGRIGNIDLEALTNTENPVDAFIVPSNVRDTGFAAVDAAIAASRKVDNKHTLNGQDWNNVAPRLGLAWAPSDSGSCAAVTASFSTAPPRRSSTRCSATIPSSARSRSRRQTALCQLRAAFSQQDPTYPFNEYLPNRIVRTGGATGTLQIRDGTQVTRGADGSNNPINPATGLPTVGNIAETFDFRAVDRNLRTPYAAAVQRRRAA